MAKVQSRTRHVAAVAAASFLGFALFLLSDFSHENTVKAVDDIGIVVFSVVALVFSIGAARIAEGRLRAAWTLLSLALAAWSMGEVIWAYDELILGEIPFPSVADGFFLAFPIGAGAALLLFRNRRGEGSGIRLLFDGFIVAGALFVISWILVLSKIYETGAASTFEFVLLVAYPLADLVLLTMATIVLISAPAGQRVPITLITLGLACMAVADSAYAYLSVQGKYVSGVATDLGWVAGLLLLTVAATVGRFELDDERAVDEVPGWASVWLPIAPVMLAGMTLIFSHSDARSSGPVVVAGLFVTMSVLVRQFLAVRENRRLISAVAAQAFRDPLTGLANRALFRDRLTHALQMRERYGTPVAVMVLDLDDFKLVNDNLGHHAGDQLLNMVGERLSGVVRPGDTVARLGGDEFAILLEGEQAHPEGLAGRVRSAFDIPITLEGHDLLVRPSLGTAAAKTDQAPSADDLLKQADLAMYAAKRSARSPSTGGGEAVQLLGELRRAVEQGELSLVYQPQFDLRTSQMVGAEALVRWRHPSRGLISPDEFLPLVRGHQLMVPITDFVLNRALDDAKRWASLGLDLPVAVNLSTTAMAQPDLPERIGNALAARGLAASSLVIEITEDLFLEDSASARRILLQLRDKGVSVAIDDFGSGYSALWYLRDLPVDKVKLDRSFVAPIASDPKAAAVARAVIDLAHVLLMTTVAEGVEDEQTAQLLRLYGCDVAQGYLYSPPVTAEEIAGSRAAQAAAVSIPRAPVSGRSS